MEELDSTYGALLIGTFISAVLLGITNLQTLIYFQQYPGDKSWTKISVAWLWALDATHLALCIHMVYWYLVTNYLNPLALVDIVWSFKAQIVVDAIVVTSVHTLYTIRLWRLMRETRESMVHKLLPAAVMIIVISLGYGTAILICYEITRFNTYPQLLASKWVTYLPLGTATLVDAVIASSLCYFLGRCRTGLTRIDSTISTLMAYTLNTGIITSLCSVTAIATMAALPTTFAVISVEFMVTKLYVNSFLAMLNARQKLRGQGCVVDADAVLQPLASESSGTGRKATTFSFGHTSSTGRSDLRISLERVPAIDIDIDEEHSIRFAYSIPIDDDAHIALDKDQPSRPTPIPTRAQHIDLYTPLRLPRSRVVRRAAYDAFPSYDDSLLSRVEDVWVSYCSQAPAETSSKPVATSYLSQR